MVNPVSRGVTEESSRKVHDSGNAPRLPALAEVAESEEEEATARGWKMSIASHLIIL